MSTDSTFDAAAAHRYFSAHCFNAAWELLEKANRTPAEDEEMIRLAQASLWHWTQRPDCTAKHLSIGYWQLSRIHAVLEDAESAKKFGNICLEKTPSDDPFCLGYAYEALARAERLAGGASQLQDYLAKAAQQADRVTDAADKEMLLADLQSLQSNDS